MNSRLVFLFVLLVSMTAISPANTIHYQAKLTGFPQPSSGVIDLRFEIFSGESGGSALYSETQHNVPINDSIVSVEIGTIVPMPDDFFLPAKSHNFLQVSVDVDDNGSFEAVLLPRSSLMPMVPYAFEANHAKTADGLSGSTGTTLLNLRSYDAVVGSGGTFVNLSSALAAGKKNIFVRSGIYTEPHALQINTDYVNITGENPSGVQITIQAGGSPAISIQKADTFTYSTGSVNVSNGSTNVGGSLADFSGVSPGDLLIVLDAVYRIASASSGNLNLSEPYSGRTKVGLEYRIIRPIAATRLTNLWFKTNDNTVPLIKWTNGSAGELNNIILSGGNPNLALNTCVYLKLHFSQIMSAGTVSGLGAVSADNVTMSNSSLCEFTDCAITKATQHGFDINGGRSNTFTACNISDNAGRGWSSSGLFDKIVNCTTSNNGGSGVGAGIYMDAIGQTAVGNSSLSNSGAGIYVNGNRCQVGNNQISSNLGNGVDVFGDGANIASNSIGQCDIGIHLHASNDATMIGNALKDNSNDVDYSSSNDAFPSESGFESLNHAF